MLSVTAAVHRAAVVPCRSKPSRAVSVRRRTVFVAARTKGEVEDEFQAQQNLLELRRRKAEVIAAREKPAPGGHTMPPEKPADIQKAKAVREEPDPEAQYGSTTPNLNKNLKKNPEARTNENLDDSKPVGFLGKLFGRAK